MIRQHYQDINSATIQEEGDRLKKLLAGAQDLKEAVSLGEQLSTATDSDKSQLKAELAAKMGALREYTGDRYSHTEITEVAWSDQNSNNQSGGASTQPVWPP